MKENKTTQKKKSGNASTIILVAIFFVGLTVLLYPTISDFWNEKRQSQAIVNYDDLIVDLTPEDYSALFDAADAYNKKIVSNINKYFNNNTISDFIKQIKSVI